jgi:hypothetical protein
MQGINVSNINWQMIESADPIEFTLRYVGKDTTLESLKELRRLIASGESESNKLCHKLCQWIVENKRNPSLLNDEEKCLFYFMTDMRKGRNNPNNQGRMWYQSNQKIAESYGLNNIFDNKDYENIAVENCHKLCQFIKENDRYPKASSEDKIERTLNTFILNQRRNKINKGFIVSFSQLRLKMDILKSVGAAGSSAVITVTGIHPIDVVKTRLQVSGEGGGRNYKALGIGGSVKV